jgi:hypothetical protein
MSIEECAIALYGLFMKGLATIVIDKETNEMYFAATDEGKAAVLIEAAMFDLDFPDIDE